MPVDGLSFDLLSSTHEPVTTGHADGLVTLDLAEADDTRREARRAELGEPYRTVLGHLRHEAGHAVFELLAPDGQALERTRAHHRHAADRGGLRRGGWPPWSWTSCVWCMT